MLATQPARPQLLVCMPMLPARPFSCCRHVSQPNPARTRSAFHHAHAAVANGVLSAAVATEPAASPNSKQPAGEACALNATPPPVSAPQPASQQLPSTPSPAPAPAPDPSQANPLAPTSGFQLRPIHFTVFTLIFVGGAMFATVTLQFTAGLEFSTAVATVVRRVAKSVAFRQLVVISSAILLLRYGMNNFLQALSKFSSSPVQWDKTKLFYILREVYQPLELLLFIAAVCTVSDAYVPSLIGVPRATVSHVVKSILSTSFILGFASVVFNLKSRFCKENAWQAEMKGDVTTQRRWEAYDKLGTFVIYVMSFVLGIQALGLEVTSVLAIGGIGGLAIGLAGREICENLLNGFLIMSTTPFEVGDEITFFHNNKTVEGIVIDVGWYRTNVRSFEREVYVIPNAVFSKNIILNVSRKNREWRFYEMLHLRLQDVHKSNAVVQDIRRIVRNDTRVINKLHRRIFLDKITPEDARIYMSFYLEAANRDAFMAIKQDLLVSFVDCVERNGAKLAMPRTVVDMDPEMAEALGSVGHVMQGLSAYAMAQNMSNTTQGLQGARVLTEATPTTINAEATAVPTTSSTSSSGMQGTVVVTATPVTTPAAASSNGTSTSSNGNGSSAVPSQPPLAAQMEKQSNSPASSNSSPVKASQTNGQATSSASQAASASSGSSSSGPSAGAPPPSGGTKAGDVYSVPQSTVVVSVPATGVPIAFAGSVSNNVVTATIPLVPLSTTNGSSSSNNGSSRNASPGSNGSSLNGGGGGGGGFNGTAQAGSPSASSQQGYGSGPASSQQQQQQQVPASSQQQQGPPMTIRTARSPSPPATFPNVRQPSADVPEACLAATATTTRSSLSPSAGQQQQQHVYQQRPQHLQRGRGDRFNQQHLNDGTQRKSQQQEQQQQQQPQQQQQSGQQLVIMASFEDLA